MVYILLYVIQHYSFDTDFMSIIRSTTTAIRSANNAEASIEGIASMCNSLQDFSHRWSASIVLNACKHRLVSAAVCSFLSLLSAPGYATDLDAMSENISDKLEGNVNGYAFAIAKYPTEFQYVFMGSEAETNWRTGAGGTALRSVDTGDGEALMMTSNTRSFIASVTKAITAVALLQLLESKNISLHDPIHSWLPKTWVLGPGFDQITYYQLLRHETGLKQIFNDLSPEAADNWGNDWEGLKWIVENGATPGDVAQYKNANYALMRILIMKLWRTTPGAEQPGILYPNHAGFWYMDYVKRHIFEPSGVAPGASCSATDMYQAQARAYNVNEPEQPGGLSESSSQHCGGHVGLRLSAVDLVRIAYHLQNGGLLSRFQRYNMDRYQLGWRSRVGVKGGFAYSHGGDWDLGNGNAYHACIMKLPNKTVASLVVNSDIIGYYQSCYVLQDAYNTN